MGVIVQKNCVLRVGKEENLGQHKIKKLLMSEEEYEDRKVDPTEKEPREFLILAILMHQRDGEYAPVLQVQDPITNSILYFDIRKDILLDFEEDYVLEAK